MRQCEAARSQEYFGSGWGFEAMSFPSRWSKQRAAHDGADDSADDQHRAGGHHRRAAGLIGAGTPEAEAAGHTSKNERGPHGNHR